MPYQTLLSPAENMRRLLRVQGRTWGADQTDISLLARSLVALYDSDAAGNVPDQTGANGLFLTSNGTVASWAAIPSTSSFVVGPASATDNAIVRFDAGTGKLVQDSVLTIADTTGAMAGWTTGAGLTLHGGGTITGASGALTITGATTFSTSITNSSLTAGRVTFSGAAGLLSDDADFTFSVATLTATNVTVPTLLTLSSTSGTSAGGILFGADTNLYRTGAGELRIVDTTNAGTGLAFMRGVTSQGAFYLDNVGNFYQSSAGTLIYRTNGTTTALTLSGSDQSATFAGYAGSNTDLATPSMGSIGYRLFSSNAQGANLKGFGAVNDLVLMNRASEIVLSIAGATTKVALSSTALGTTSADGLIVQNTTDAAAGAQQLGPRIGSWGEGWKTDATASSIVVGSGFETLPVEGSAAPSLITKFWSKIGASAVTYPMTLTSAGVLTAAGGITSSGGSVTASAALYLQIDSRLAIGASGDGVAQLTNFAGSAGVSLDVATDATLKVRNRANNADAAITAGAGTFSGQLIGTPDTRSGAGAVSVTTLTTILVSAGVGDALTLANGTAGQIKTLAFDVRTGGSDTMVLTPATKTGFATITFTAIGQTATLQYFATRGWMLLASVGATIG